MPKNEDGEFELLLGNRQLMSVFFIVVILLGVFFAMGYIVGRNSSPVAVPEVASRRPETKATPDVTPSTREAPRETATPAPADAPTETVSQPKETASQQGPATKPTPPPEPGEMQHRQEAVTAAREAALSDCLPIDRD